MLVYCLPEMIKDALNAILKSVFIVKYPYFDNPV